MDKDIKLCFEACVLIEDKTLVCCAFNMNLVFTVDLVTNEIKILGSIPEEPFFKRQLIGSIQYWNGQLFFIPLTASKLWIYNINSKSWKSISLGNKIEERVKFKFAGAFIKNGNLYMLGYQYFGIVIMKLSDKYSLEFVPDRNWDKSSFEFIWGSSFARIKNKLYMASCSNKLIIFDLSEKTYEYINIGLPEERFVGVCNYKGDLWVAPLISTSDIIVYGKWRIDIKGISQKYSDYNSICICGNEMFISGCTENSIKINIDEIPYIPEIVQEKIYYNNYVNDQLAIRSGYGYMDVYSVAENKWKRFSCKIKNKLFLELAQLTSDNNFMKEDELDNLNLFMTIICG